MTCKNHENKKQDSTLGYGLVYGEVFLETGRLVIVWKVIMFAKSSSGLGTKIQQTKIAVTKI